MTTESEKHSSGGAFIGRRLGRRNVLRGAAALGGAAPLLWPPSEASAATPAIGPRWIAFGPVPTSQMYVSWSAGSASAKTQKPSAPKIRYGRDESYGIIKPVDSSAPVPLPSPATGEPAENTIYNTVLLTSLAAGTTYHYAVSNDGVTWSADATFTTAVAAPSSFRFTAFGDQATSTATAGPMASLVSSLQPAFHVIAGDLSYSTPLPLKYPDVTGFKPAQWDAYLKVVGPRAAQSIPWHASVGAHEIEPLGNHGYAGFVTRFPQAYDLTSGSPVVHTYTYGTVAFIHLDGNDLSAQETVNTGYTNGAQTAWLATKLAGYRSDPTIDFIVAICNCSCYSSNREHGSDGGLRDVWGPIFDQYAVDLVLSGHVHAYERSNPIRGGVPTRYVPAGGTIDPGADGTTYICAGGGGNGLYPTWYGTTGSGDAGNSTKPKIWRWSSGKSVNVTDTVEGYSAVRRAVYSCVVVDAAPASPSQPATMHIRTLMPAQHGAAVTSIANPTVIDSISLVRS